MNNKLKYLLIFLIIVLIFIYLTHGKYEFFSQNKLLNEKYIKIRKILQVILFYHRDIINKENKEDLVLKFLENFDEQWEKNSKIKEHFLNLKKNINIKDLNLKAKIKEKETSTGIEDIIKENSSKLEKHLQEKNKELEIFSAKQKDEINKIKALKTAEIKKIEKDIINRINLEKSKLNNTKKNIDEELEKVINNNLNLYNRVKRENEEKIKKANDILKENISKTTSKYADEFNSFSLKKNEELEKINKEMEIKIEEANKKVNDMIVEANKKANILKKEIYDKKQESILKSSININKELKNKEFILDELGKKLGEYNKEKDIINSRINKEIDALKQSKLKVLSLNEKSKIEAEELLEETKSMLDSKTKLINDGITELENKARKDTDIIINSLNLNDNVKKVKINEINENLKKNIINLLENNDINNNSIIDNFTETLNVILMSKKKIDDEYLKAVIENNKRKEETLKAIKLKENQETKFEYKTGDFLNDFLINILKNTMAGIYMEEKMFKKLIQEAIDIIDFNNISDFYMFFNKNFLEFYNND